MIAAIAMSVLSIGALLEIALATAIRSRGRRRRHAEPGPCADLAADVTADLAPTGRVTAAMAPACGGRRR
ncbi:MAG TPA: hypothetical protein VGJ95_23430 [Pseudonocardiaceae bacterium]|jgi:hypothetical protein